MNFSPNKRVTHYYSSRVALLPSGRKRVPLDEWHLIEGYATSPQLAKRQHSSARRVMLPFCFLKIKLKEYQAS